MLVTFYCLQRIPTSIVSVLGIPKSGEINLLKDGSDDSTPATYYTLGDGRIRFRSAWNSFCHDNGLVAGKLVLIMFTKIENIVFMSADVVN